MTKKQFLDGLYQSLLVGMNKEEIYSHIQYYDEYIESEKIKGKSEEEVIKELGSPRLIAKTILNTVDTTTRNDYQSDVKDNNDIGTKTNKSIWKSIKTFLITIFVVFIIFQIIKFAFVLFIRVGLPILLIVLVYRFIKGLFR